LNLGPGGHTIAIAANPVDGSVFIVAVAAVASGVYTNRVIKTGANGNPIASFDFSFGSSDNYGFAGPNAAAVDAQGNLLLVGGTSPADFPATADLISNPSGTEAFVVRIDSNLTRVMSGVLLGGNANGGRPPYALGSAAMAVATDAAGNVYVAGSTNAPDFPISSGAFQTRPPRIAFASFSFVTKLSPDLTK